MFLNPTERRIEDLLLKITYKPGWKLSTKSPYPNYLESRSERERTTIFCTILTKDVDSGQDIILSLQHPMGPFYNYEIDDKQLITMIADVVRRFEEHEFREWFKIDGFQVFDPHPELRSKEQPFRGSFSYEDSRCG